MSHRQGLHSDDRPYPGEPLCYCDEKPTPHTSEEAARLSIQDQNNLKEQSAKNAHSSDKVHAYVIRDATDFLDDTPKWGLVNQTEYMEDGRWISGMNLITSIEDVLDRAEQKGVPIIFESMLTSQQNINSVDIHNTKVNKGMGENNGVQKDVK